MTALSVLCSPPYSGAFIAVVADGRWTPFSPQSESFSYAADQDSLVASLLGNELANRRWTLCPLTSLLLVGPAELVLGLVAFYRSPWIRYPGILQGERYIGLYAHAE